MKHSAFLVVLTVNLLSFLACTTSSSKDFALLIIDVQNDYFQGGSHALYNSLDATSNIENVLRQHREKGNHIIHVQHINPKGAGFFEPDTTGVKIHERVTPLANEPLIVKHQVSSFANTDLEKILREKGIKRLIICGMQTNVCVEGTAMNAVELGYGVTVLNDACAAINMETHDSAINRLKNHVSVHKTDEVVSGN
jgi:nicotinamidase-related amidase